MDSTLAVFVKYDIHSALIQPIMLQTLSLFSRKGVEGCWVERCGFVYCLKKREKKLNGDREAIENLTLNGGVEHLGRMEFASLSRD